MVSGEILTLPKLMYFGVYARAEPIRMLLNLAKVKYEDDRVSFE